MAPAQGRRLLLYSALADCQIQIAYLFRLFIEGIKGALMLGGPNRALSVGISIFRPCWTRRGRKSQKIKCPVLNRWEIYPVSLRFVSASEEGAKSDLTFARYLLYILRSWRR